MVDLSLNKAMLQDVLSKKRSPSCGTKRSMCRLLSSVNDAVPPDSVTRSYAASARHRSRRIHVAWAYWFVAKVGGLGARCRNYR